jgi:hypothetical protein
MKIRISWLGSTLVILYLIVAALIAFRVAGCTPRPITDLFGCDFGVFLVILPVAAPLGLIGIPLPGFDSPGPGAWDILLFILYVLICAGLLYLIGYLVGRVFGWILRRS